MFGRHSAIVALLTFVTSPVALESRGGDSPGAKIEIEMAGREEGQIRNDNALGMHLVWCPPGTFVMENVDVAERTGDINGVRYKVGDVTEYVPARVVVTRGYWLGKFEVTQAEWKDVMATEPWMRDERARHGKDFPATIIRWKEAMEFCGRLTEKERQAGRLPNDWEYTLPTEAQWECACRARTVTLYSFGDTESDLESFGWFFDNTSKVGRDHAHRVGKKKPNPFGLHDMHGNVAEWCRDYFDKPLPGGRNPERRTPGELPKAGMFRVVRGGGWGNSAPACRSSNRGYWIHPSHRGNYVGLRVALVGVRPGD